MNLYKKIEELKLNEIYSFVMENNKAAYLPYHCNFHLEMVCEYALIIAEYMKISKSDQKLIAIASLFHDFNHTGSGKDDSKNIKIACDEFEKYCDKNLVKKISEAFLSEKDRKTIISIIEATKFPYEGDGKDLTDLQKIVRDADVVQSLFTQNYINGVVLAIAKEGNIPVDKMLDGQIKFMTDIKYLTDYANELKKKELPNAVAKVKEAKKLYGVK